MGVEIIVTSEFMRLALETLQKDIDFIEKGIWMNMNGYKVRGMHL
jgi:hypothetical protein